MPRNRSYSRVTRQALTMLGKLIRIGRAERGLTAQDLADRAGIAGIGGCAVTLAEAEGLEAHANAVRLRLGAAA